MSWSASPSIRMNAAVALAFAACVSGEGCPRFCCRRCKRGRSAERSSLSGEGRHPRVSGLRRGRGGPPRPRCRRSLKILIDAKLPPGRKVMLAAAGHQANHVVDVGLRDAADAQVWEYSARERIAVLTKDEDFAARRLREPQGPTIIWLRGRQLLARCARTMADATIASIEAARRGRGRRHRGALSRPRPGATRHFRS